VGHIGASFEDKDYVANIEKRANDFLQLMDDLFTACADLTSRDSEFLEKLEEYKARILNLRQEHKQITAGWFFSDLNKLAETNWHPYPYLPPEFIIKIGIDKMTYSEKEKDVTRMRNLVKEAEKSSKRFKPSTSESGKEGEK
jgi:hypothetical protein